MAAHGLPVGGRVGLQQARAALQVGEQEGDRARRQVRRWCWRCPRLPHAPQSPPGHSVGAPAPAVNPSTHRVGRGRGRPRRTSPGEAPTIMRLSRNARPTGVRQATACFVGPRRGASPTRDRARGASPRVQCPPGPRVPRRLPAGAGGVGAARRGGPRPPGRRHHRLDAGARRGAAGAAVRPSTVHAREAGAGVFLRRSRRRGGRLPSPACHGAGAFRVPPSARNMQGVPEDAPGLCGHAVSVGRRN